MAAALLGGGSRVWVANQSTRKNIIHFGGKYYNKLINYKQFLIWTCFLVRAMKGPREIQSWDIISLFWLVIMNKQNSNVY